MPAYIRPPMKSVHCWTHEPEYDRYLHVRVYKPEGLDYRELRCYFTLGKTFHKTGILDPPPVSLKMSWKVQMFFSRLVNYIYFFLYKEINHLIVFITTQTLRLKLNLTKHLFFTWYCCILFQSIQ